MYIIKLTCKINRKIICKIQFRIIIIYITGTEFIIIDPAIFLIIPIKYANSTNVRVQ